MSIQQPGFAIAAALGLAFSTAEAPRTVLLIGSVVAFFAVLLWATLKAQKKQAEDRKYARENIERHRLHAERSEEHMARVESLIERIARALEQRQPP
jgi:hypothetical protein